MYSKYVGGLAEKAMLSIAIKLNKLMFRIPRRLRRVLGPSKRFGTVNPSCYSSPKLHRKQHRMTSWSRNGPGRTRRLQASARATLHHDRENPSISNLTRSPSLIECLLRWVLEHLGANVCFTVLQTLLYHTALQLFRHRGRIRDACIQSNQLIVVKHAIH